jgi:uncharacterized protein YneR
MVMKKYLFPPAGCIIRSRKFNRGGVARLVFATLLAGFFYTAAAQVPQGINYQALARDASGTPIASQTIQVRLTILSSLAPDVIQWEELHGTVVTDVNGLFTLVLGSGVRQPASAVALFSDINWNVPEMHLRTHVTYESVEHLMGTSRLLAVPYALTAGDISGSLKKLNVLGETAVMDEPLFEVKNKNNKTVFAVYNEGVRVYVDDGSSKAVKGGFAIGSFDETKGYQEYFMVNADCVRVYIDDSPGKAVKGGFAIGSFDETKLPYQEYLRVTRDSTRVYLNSDGTKKGKGGFAIGSFDETKGIGRDYLTVSADSVRVYIEEDSEGKAVKGGFAIGGFDETKGVLQNLMRVTLDSTRIFVNDSTKGFSVANIQSGATSDFMKMNKLNYFIGHQSGKVTKPSSTGEGGRYNVFVGYQSGNENTIGYKNVFMGFRAGMSNLSAEHNIFIGTESGILNQTGRYNTYVGSQTGAFCNGNANTFVGFSAGVATEAGEYNTAVGTNSGTSIGDGTRNAFFGWASGNANSGSGNVFLGASAGSSNLGSGNVLIGFNANVAGSYKFMIKNRYGQTDAPPLLFGEFNNQRLAVNRATTNADYTFYVEGASGGTSAWANLSDINKKKNIETISGALDKVTRLRGVTFEWKDDQNYEKGRRMGFIAQEAELLIPEVVNPSEEGYSMQYAPITALLVEAIKEQQHIIENQNSALRTLEAKTQNLESTVSELIAEISRLKSIINH